MLLSYTRELSAYPIGGMTVKAMASRAAMTATVIKVMLQETLSREHHNANRE
jgi:hypothetical protein